MVAPHPNQDSASIPQISFNPAPFLSQTHWEVNYATGNNNNDGLTSGTALADVGEIRRRWNGGVSGVRPTLPGIDILINITNNAPDFTDPLSVLWDVNAEPGCSIVIDGQVTTKRAGQISSVPNPFARTPTGQQTVTDAGVADWTADVDQPLVDTTSGAWSWVVKGGAAGTLAASRAQVTAGFASAAGIINGGLGAAAVANADNYDIATMPTCYFGVDGTFRMQPGSTDAGGNGIATVLVRHLHGKSQNVNDVLQVHGNGTFPEVTATGGWVVFAECIMEQSRVAYDGTCLANCAGTGSNNLNFTQIQTIVADFGALMLSGYQRHDLYPGNQAVIDQDLHLLRASVSIIPRGVYGQINIGNVGVYSTNAHSAITCFIGSNFAKFLFGPEYEAQGIFYGTTNGQPIVSVPLGVIGGSFVAQLSAANTFVFDGGGAATFTLGGLTTGFAIVAATGQPLGPRNLTVTLLDTAQGGGGFGGLATQPASGNFIQVSA